MQRAEGQGSRGFVAGEFANTHSSLSVLPKRLVIDD